MNRIDLPHLVWALEELVAGRVVNQITVDPDTAHHARVALDQMLALPGADTPPPTAADHPRSHRWYGNALDTPVRALAGDVTDSIFVTEGYAAGARHTRAVFSWPPTG